MQTVLLDTITTEGQKRSLIRVLPDRIRLLTQDTPVDLIIQSYLIHDRPTAILEKDYLGPLGFVEAEAFKILPNANPSMVAPCDTLVELDYLSNVVKIDQQTILPLDRKQICPARTAMFDSRRQDLGPFESDRYDYCNNAEIRQQILSCLIGYFDGLAKKSAKIFEPDRISLAIAPLLTNIKLFDDEERAEANFNTCFWTWVKVCYTALFTRGFLMCASPYDRERIVHGPQESTLSYNALENFYALGKRICAITSDVSISAILSAAEDMNQYVRDEAEFRSLKDRPPLSGHEQIDRAMLISQYQQLFIDMRSMEKT